MESLEEDLNFMGIDREIASILQKHNPGKVDSGTDVTKNQVSSSFSSDSGPSDQESEETEETSTVGLFFLPENKSDDEKSGSEDTSDTDTDVSTESLEQKQFPTSLATKGLFDVDSCDEESLLFSGNSDNNPPKVLDKINEQNENSENTKVAHSEIQEDRELLNDPLGVNSLSNNLL